MERIHLYLSAGGIGDAVCGLYAACGIANLGYDVVFQTHHQAWLQRCYHPHVRIEDHREFGIDLNRNYEKQLEVSNSRKQWYCDNVSEILGMEKSTFIPSAPEKVDCSIHDDLVITYHPKTAKNILLVPFTAGSGRDWHELHWLRLTELCLDAGFNVSAMDSHIARLRGLFDRAFGKWINLFQPIHIDSALDIILSSAVVIGLDSGMAHVAALHNIPTIALMSIYPRDLVLSHTTDVLGIMPQSNCAGCRGLYKKGYRKSCKQGCSAMLTISPEEVFSRVKIVESNSH